MGGIQATAGALSVCYLLRLHLPHCSSVARGNNKSIKL